MGPCHHCRRRELLLRLFAEIASAKASAQKGQKGANYTPQSGAVHGVPEARAQSSSSSLVAELGVLLEENTPVVKAKGLLSLYKEPQHSDILRFTIQMMCSGRLSAMLARGEEIQKYKPLSYGFPDMKKYKPGR